MVRFVGSWKGGGVMKTRSTFFSNSTIAISALVISASGAFAQSRTWVSGTGDDANPGSLTAPCKTIPGAIGKTSAGGEINVLTAGSFGAVTIVKSITIDGQGVMTAMSTTSGGNCVTINAGANDVVTLRNLSMNGFGTASNGIRVLNAAEVNIENCVITEFAGRGIDIQSSGACRVNLKGTIIRGCGVAAIGSSPTTSGAVFLTLKECNLLASAIGLRCDDRTKVAIEDCELCGNTSNGLQLLSGSGSYAEAHITNCLLTDNGGSAISATGATSVVRAGLCTITSNKTGLTKVTGGLIQSYGNNRLRSNATNGTFSAVIGTD